MEAIEVKDLKKVFKQGFRQIEVLKGVSFVVKKWEIYGFIGPNGAGKTTTIKCILGFLRPTEGEVKILGQSPFVNRQIFKKIGFAPENTYFYDHLSWWEFLMFMGMLAWMHRSEIELRAMTLLEKVDLLDARKKLIKSYSKWMKQRLGIAAAIINDPEVVFFDEPMSGLDPLGRILVKNLMKELKSEGKTVFFNTHILSDVEEIADRFAMILAGKIIFEGTMADIEGKNLEEFFIEQVKQHQEEKLG